MFRFHKINSIDSLCTMDKNSFVARDSGASLRNDLPSSQALPAIYIYIAGTIKLPVVGGGGGCEN